MKELRFVHLDMARGVAALLVCAQHLRHVDFIDYGVLEPKPTLLDKLFYFLTGQGHNAVMIFFVLSGFFVAGSVAGDFERGTWSWKKFAARRLSRLYVVLVPALLLTLFWDGVSRQFAPAGDFGQHGTASFGASLLFLQCIFTQPFGTNSVLWSVAYEFWYYLMFPLLFAAVALRPSSGKKWTCSVLFLICILILPAKVLMGGLIWLLGYVAHVLSHDKRFSGAAANSAVFICGAILLIFSVSLMGTPHGDKPVDFTIISFRDIFTGLSFSLMVPFLAGHQPRSRLYHAMALGLSETSYTLYSVHFPFVVFLSCALIGEKSAIPSLVSYTLFVAYLALILLYATAIWWLFEYRTGVVRRWVERKLR